eukprot:1158233-Pelagomonas_calceolata.AAC.4
MASAPGVQLLSGCLMMLRQILWGPTGGVCWLGASIEMGAGAEGRTPASLPVLHACSPDWAHNCGLKCCLHQNRKRLDWVPAVAAQGKKCDSDKLSVCLKTGCHAEHTTSEGQALFVLWLSCPCWQHMPGWLLASLPCSSIGQLIHAGEVPSQIKASHSASGQLAMLVRA